MLHLPRLSMERCHFWEACSEDRVLLPKEKYHQQLKHNQMLQGRLERMGQSLEVMLETGTINWCMVCPRSGSQSSSDRIAPVPDSRHGNYLKVEELHVGSCQN